MIPYRILSTATLFVFVFFMTPPVPADATAMTVAAATPSMPVALEGVDLPTTLQVNGTVLSINGAGVRAISVFGFHFKIYVAGLYTATPLRSQDQALNTSGPLQMVFTFLRTVSHQKVKEAWERQLDASVSYSYDGYARDREVFIHMFGPTANGGTQMVQFVGDDTVVHDQGLEKGVILGRHFQRAFLSMWFGEKAVAADLMAGLLGSVSHAPTP
jgi:Chalcone isomerase-like